MSNVMDSVAEAGRVEMLDVFLEHGCSVIDDYRWYRTAAVGRGGERRRGEERSQMEDIACRLFSPLAELVVRTSHSVISLTAHIHMCILFRPTSCFN